METSSQGLCYLTAEDCCLFLHLFPLFSLFSCQFIESLIFPEILIYFVASYFRRLTFCREPLEFVIAVFTRVMITSQSHLLPSVYTAQMFICTSFVKYCQCVRQCLDTSIKGASRARSLPEKSWNLGQEVANEKQDFLCDWFGEHTWRPLVGHELEAGDGEVGKERLQTGELQSLTHSDRVLISWGDLLQRPWLALPH